VDKGIITKVVWTLSLVSLSTDVASEMLYPVMPVFLRSIGFSILLIGVLEGVAEATAGLSKGYFGKLSDTRGRRVPFVQLGYLLSAIAKPLLAVAVYPLWIFVCRTLDRLGKGIRTGARDAILSAEATGETKARIFGFHRSMDSAGAFIGPSLALVFLYFYPGAYRSLFLIAFIPGCAAVILTLLLKESTRPGAAGPKDSGLLRSKKAHFFSFLKYWSEAPASYRKLVTGLLFFALINSSDVFLLLKMKESGLSDTGVIGVYIFYNLIYAVVAYPAGALGDRWGLKNTLALGLLVFAIVYGGMAVDGGWWWYGFLFFLYAFYAACTESIAKAWIANISHEKDVATAIGTYTAFQSICTLFASVLAGWIWYTWGGATLFLTTGILALGAAIYFGRLKVA
jgi:MFS family permease